MRIFIDTSAFYALLDRDDQNHPRARNAWKAALDSKAHLTTSNYVLAETFALLQTRLGLGAVRGFQQEVVPILQVEFITPELHRLGMAALLSAARRGLSLVDCVSFEVMRNLEITASFVFDSHFREQGFLIVP